MSHLHHKISALIDGELSPNARTRALAHARSCPECRRELAETLEVKRRISRLAPIEISADLLDVVASLHPCPVAVSSTSRPRLLRKVVLGVGSVSAVVVALAYVVGAPAEQVQARSVSPPVEEFTAEFAQTTGTVPLADPAVEVLSVQRAGGSSSTVLLGPTSRPLHPRERTFAFPDGGPTSAAPAPTVTTSRGDDPQALALLRSAVLAPAHVGFTADRVIRSFAPSGVETFRMQVTHGAGQGTEYDVVGPSGQLTSQSFVMEAHSSTAKLEGQTLAPLAAAYDLTVEGPEDVDGRATTVIAATEGSQVRARFWIDNRTGLLMRRALYADGRLVRWSGYTSFQQRPNSFLSHLAPEVRSLPATTISTTIASALSDKGWTCPRSLDSSFRLSSLGEVDGDADAMHAQYTDGLSTVSVFEERATLDPSRLAGFRLQRIDGMNQYVHDGLPTVVVWESGGTIYTVVTDAPEQVAGTVIAALPHTAAHSSDGLMARVDHGLSRMASAVAP